MSDSLQSINNLQAFGNDNNLKHNVAFNSIMNQHMTGVPRPLTSDAQKTDLDKEKEIEKDLDKYFDIMNTKSEETLDPKNNNNLLLDDMFSTNNNSNLNNSVDLVQVALEVSQVLQSKMSKGSELVQGGANEMQYHVKASNKSDLKRKNTNENNKKKKKSKYDDDDAFEDGSGDNRYETDEEIQEEKSERKFKCETCVYSTNIRNHLVIHRRIHTGEKPFKCDLCIFTAARRDYLREHILGHTGEKPHKCTTCTYASVRKSDLNRHMKKCKNPTNRYIDRYQKAKPAAPAVIIPMMEQIHVPSIAMMEMLPPNELLPKPIEAEKDQDPSQKSGMRILTQIMNDHTKLPDTPSIPLPPSLYSTSMGNNGGGGKGAIDDDIGSFVGMPRFESL